MSPLSLSSTQRRLSHIWLGLALLLAQWAGLGHGLSHAALRLGGVVQVAHSSAPAGESSGQPHVCLDCLAYSALDAPLGTSSACVPLLALGLVLALFSFHSRTPCAPRFFLSRAPPLYS